MRLCLHQYFHKICIERKVFWCFCCFQWEWKGNINPQWAYVCVLLLNKMHNKTGFQLDNMFLFIRPKCENNMTFALLFGQYMRIYIEQVQGCFSPCTGYYCVVTYIHLICINTESNVERNTWGNFWVWINTEAYLGIFEKSLMQKAVNYFQRNTQPWMLNKVINTFMYHSFSIVVTRCHSFYLVVI